MKSNSSGRDLIATNKKLQRDADKLLASSDLPSQSRRYGHVEFMGSYRLGLMTHGDIDIHISRSKPFTKTEVLKTLTRIIAKTFFTSYYFGDWYKSGKNPNFPHGYYIGLKKMYRGQKWKIDLWFMSDAEQRRRDQGRLDLRNVKLTTTQKVAILRLKQYRNGIDIVLSGQKVYEAVLLDGVTTIAGFKKWLKKQMKK
jgi:hypothetical protein